MLKHLPRVEAPGVVPQTREVPRNQLIVSVTAELTPAIDKGNASFDIIFDNKARSKQTSPTSCLYLSYNFLRLLICFERLKETLSPTASIMASQDPKELLVDSTPISPVRPDNVRRDSLEKHLQHRPDPQELKDRHILLDTNAAP